jgi:4-carboxymuconolactone decarboxylase
MAFLPPGGYERWSRSKKGIEIMRATRTIRRCGLIVALAVSTGSAWVEGGQTAAGAKPMPNFTGTVASVDASDVRSVRFKYEAGARSYWHVHDGDLVLLVEKGRGRSQVQGQKIQEFGPGQPIFLPGGVPHWHGASPKEGLTWVALSIGSNVKFMSPVSDEEYLSGAK